MPGYGLGGYGSGPYGGGSAAAVVAAHATATSGFLERTSYITPDGVEYPFLSPAFIMQEEGLGMPPIDFVTQRGPFQHGESVKAAFLKPRTIQVVVRRNACSRAEYWNIRNTLLDILRPNRQLQDPGIYRKRLANGQIRDWLVYATEGPGFPSHDPGKWDEWSVQDTIRFTAFDPVAFDPNLQSVSFISSGSIGAFPITFPWQIASFGVGAQSVTYDGTWLTYPTLLFSGPLTGPSIRNITTDEQISLAVAIPPGAVVTMDLSYGRKTATLDNGTNVIGYVSADSDVASFHLEPGINQLQVSATGTSSASSITLQYYRRFVGA